MAGALKFPQFDALLASMQAPKVKKAMAIAFDASPAKLGRAAVKAARKGRTAPPPDHGCGAMLGRK